MKRNGSITIIALLIISLALVSSILLIYISTLQVSIAATSLDSVQAKYISEYILNTLIYNKEKFQQYFFYNTLDGCRASGERFPSKGEWNIRFKEDKDLNEYSQDISYFMNQVDERKNIILKIKTKYKNIPSNIIAYIDVIHEIFQLNKPYIFINDLSQDYKNKLISLLEEIHDNCFDYDCKITASVRRINNIDGNISINVNSKNSDREIIIDNEGQVSSFSNKYIILTNLLNESTEKPSLIIGNIEDDSLLKLNGVMYVEGDVIVNQNLEFDGIIIVNDGKIIINTDIPPIIKGVILHNDDIRINEEDLVLIHDQDNIWNFGSYIPGFITPRLNLIKRY